MAAAMFASSSVLVRGFLGREQLLPSFWLSLLTQFRELFFTVAEILPNRGSCGKTVGREIERKPLENWQIWPGILI